MSIYDVLKDEYNIQEIVELIDISKNIPCYRIVTPGFSYVLKQADRPDFVRIYHKVQNILNEKGLIQGRLIPTRKNRLLSKTGYSLMEYVSGDALEKYNDEQYWLVINYLSKYNQMLREVPFEATEIDMVNHWDKMRSVAFICRKVEEILSQHKLDENTKLLLNFARKTLLDHEGYFSRISKQLIHSDLGPGNIVFCGNKVHSIIDFTPDYENELYALSHFIYWTCLWQFSESTSLNKIRSTLKVYYNGDIPQHSFEGLFPYLVKGVYIEF